MKSLFSWTIVLTLVLFCFVPPAIAQSQDIGYGIETEVMEMSISDMGPLESNGSFPSYRDAVYAVQGESGLLTFDQAVENGEETLEYNPAREWVAGQFPTDVIEVGDLSEMGVEQLTLDYLAQTTGLDISSKKLSSLRFLQGLNVNDLLLNVPYLKDFELSEMPSFASAIGMQNFDGSLVEAIQNNPEVGEMQLTEGELGEVEVEEIPNLDNTQLGKIPGVGDNVVANVPGLDNLQLKNFPSLEGMAGGLIPLAKQDIAFGEKEYSGTKSTPKPVSGGTNGDEVWEPIACSGGCAHIELYDADISPFKGGWAGDAWMTNKHRVKDGFGVLGAVISEAGAYRKPFGDSLVLQVRGTDEKDGSAEWGIAFRVCKRSVIDLGCTAYALEVPLPIKTFENATILTGIKDGLGGASQPIDAPAGWEDLRPATPPEVQALLGPSTPIGGGSLCGEGLGGVSYGSLAGAYGTIEGDYPSAGIFVDGGRGGRGQRLEGRGLGRYQYMSYREDVRAAIRQQEGGDAFLAKLDSGAEPSEAEILKYFPPNVQDALFTKDQDDLIEQATAEGFSGDRLVERIGQLHYGGKGAEVDGNSADDHGSLTLKTYGEKLLNAYKGGLTEEDTCKSTGKYINPMRNGYKPGNRRFGMNVHPIYGTSKFHAGDDIPAYGGEVVQAADGGVIDFAALSGGWTSGYGQLIIIDHEDGRVSRYAHLKKMSVKAGDRVAQGDQIGTVGSTGGSTGPHLHYENKQGGEFVDPAIATDYNKTTPYKE